MRAAGKAQRAHYVVVAVVTWVREAARLNFHRGRVRQEAKKIYKVANLTKDSSSALQRIVQPVIRGEEACIHAIVERQRFMYFLQEILEPNCQWGEATIEADHEKRTRCCWIVVCRDNAAEFRFVEA